MVVDAFTKYYSSSALNTRGRRRSDLLRLFTWASEDKPSAKGHGERAELASQLKRVKWELRKIRKKGDCREAEAERIKAILEEKLTEASEGRTKPQKQLDRAHCKLELARATGAEDLAEMSKLEKTMQQSMTRFSALKKRMAESQAMALRGGSKAVK